MEKPKTTNFKFFTHKDCEYFPCHHMKDEEPFNCLFCFCPLYALKDQCGGNFAYNKEGIKDCSNCTLPHRKEGYEHIVGKCKEIAALAKI